MDDRESDEETYGTFADFTPTAWLDPGPQAALRRQAPHAAGNISLIEPAVRVMTDFASRPPVTIPVDRLTDEALRVMIKARVRALFAMRGTAVVGLITACDILGVGDPQGLGRPGLTGRRGVEVGHLMRRWDALAVLDVPWLALATVADLREQFQRKRVSHLVVVQYAEGGAEWVRGIFSRAELERRLGETFSRGLLSP